MKNLIIILALALTLSSCSVIYIGKAQDVTVKQDKQHIITPDVVLDVPIIP